MFRTPAALTNDGALWVLKYIHAVASTAAAANPQIPVMFQGSIHSEEYYSTQISDDANNVFDVHNYYFAGRNVTGQDITSRLCSDAETLVGDGQFPMFVGV